MNKKVFVGMSGGVDSSVAAALLKDRGFDVTGVFIRVWNPEWLTCDWKEERRDAMRVAARLNIPFKTLDLQEEYKRNVADYMIGEYKKGRTPNPDVMCNKAIKFGGFLAWALGQGADHIATGHYARIKDGCLFAGIDKSKDQSYFLWMLTPDRIKYVMFPIGHFPKSEVRKLAQKYNLPTAMKKDSQGVCFLGKLDMREFLKHYVKTNEGNVLDLAGNTIGMHEGALFYTIGQRHGFVINRHGTSDVPLYIVDKNSKENTITVAPQTPEGNMPSRTYVVELSGIIVRSEKVFDRARVRYHQPLQKCVRKGNRVTFDEAQSVAVGQSVVFYNNDEVVGGGIIERVL